YRAKTYGYYLDVTDTNTDDLVSPSPRSGVPGTETPGQEMEEVTQVNLWRGSKLSEDRTALVTNAWSDGGKQVDDGLEVTITSESAGSQSPAYTNGAYRVDVVAGETYSLAVPVRNSGAVPFPVRMTAYFDPSGWETSGLRWLSPGETSVIKIENMVAPNDGTIRFSWRVDTNDPRLPVGGKLVLLDGIAIVQSETAPDFPFNGDGAKPVEALARRNLTKNSSFEDGKTGWGNNTTYSTASIAPSEGVSSGAALLHVANAEATGFTYLGAPRLYGLTGGQYVAVGAKFKRYSEVAYARFRYIFYNSSGGQTGSPWLTPGATELGGDYSHLTGVAQAPSGTVSVIPYAYIFDGPAGDVAPAEGTGWYVDEWITVAADTKSAAEAAVATYFDGDTPPAGSKVYRWAPDGTSLEIEMAQPPEGRTAIWDG